MFLLRRGLLTGLIHNGLDVAQIIDQKVEPLIEKALKDQASFGIKGIAFQDFSLGNNPPSIETLKVAEVSIRIPQGSTPRFIRVAADPLCSF
eukprot:6915731-Pyramimonas_sp.AAC.1